MFYGIIDAIRMFTPCSGMHNSKRRLRNGRETRQITRGRQSKQKSIIVFRPRRPRLREPTARFFRRLRARSPPRIDERLTRTSGRAVTDGSESTRHRKHPLSITGMSAGRTVRYPGGCHGGCASRIFRRESSESSSNMFIARIILYQLTRRTSSRPDLTPSDKLQSYRSSNLNVI